MDVTVELPAEIASAALRKHLDLSRLLASAVARQVVRRRQARLSAGREVVLGGELGKNDLGRFLCLTDGGNELYVTEGWDYVLYDPHAKKNHPIRREDVAKWLEVVPTERRFAIEVALLAATGPLPTQDGADDTSPDRADLETSSAEATPADVRRGALAHTSSRRGSDLEEAALRHVVPVRVLRHDLVDARE